MPFQFECTRCREQIKVPDGTGGKKTRCPHCQAVIQIPMPPIAEPPRIAPRPPLSEPQPEQALESSPSPSSRQPVHRAEPKPAVGEISQRNPFGETFREPETENPYAPPSFKPMGGGTSGGFAERQLAEARQKLLVPSVIALVVSTGSALMFGMLVFVGVVMVIDGDDEGVETLLILLGLLGLQLPAFVGVLSATFRWNYALAWVGFVCSLIPCTNICAGTLLPMIVAIWGMVALSDPAVRRQFRS